MSLIDSHCHLDAGQFASDRQQVIDRALAAGVETMVSIGTGEGPPDLEAGIRLADAYPFVYATAGVHPHDAAKATDETWPHLRDLLSHPKVVALGEIGLDYHYDFSPRDVQHRVFLRQLEIAADARKPVVIHTREAWDDTIRILAERWAPSGIGCIMHCFTGGPEQARQALDLGFHLSFAGVLTFPRAAEIREAAAITPLDRLLIETDAPYLAPVPHRGKRNEPAYLAETARRLAELRGIDFEALARTTADNWHRLCLPSGFANR